MARLCLYGRVLAFRHRQHFFQIKRCQIVAMVAPCHYGINNIQTPTTVPTPHGQYDEFVILTTGNKIFNFSRICVGL
jgi:hypothetical protein